MKDTYLLNDELLRLLEKHKMRPAELAKRIGSTPFAIYDVKSKRQALGEERFVKILRKGFGYSAKETRKIFLNAVERKYLNNS